MADRATMIGYALLIIGVAILLFTFYEAYTLYTYFRSGNSVFTQSQPSITVTPSQGNASIQASSVESSLLGGLLKAFPIGTYFSYLLAVILLGVFASVGYKLAKIGSDMIGKAPSQNKVK